ncbi:hypothetical protein ACIOHC_11140 [Streptomyces sp. NPDC088252]|uniref:hypothetical protein n=1 Tax=unclassified Streptomyces TaxID=2593676 RepID=UPI0037F2DAB7
MPEGHEELVREVKELAATLDAQIKSILELADPVTVGEATKELLKVWNEGAPALAKKRQEAMKALYEQSPRKEGWTQKKIAQHFGVSVTRAQQILAGDSKSGLVPRAPKKKPSESTK